LETTRNVEPEGVLAELFRLTPMQATFSISLLALVDDQPRVLTLKQALRVYLEHRLEVVRRRSEYDLNKAQNRAHILEGLMKALDNLDEVIEIIRHSRTVETARSNLISKFKFSELQATAILDMQLRRLAGLERKKIQDEHKETMQLIKYLERLLSSPKLMRDTIKEELTAVRDKYANNRRTQILDTNESKMITATDLLPDQQVWVIAGDKGTIARTPSAEMINIPTKPLEQPVAIQEANTQDILYLFTADGRAVSLPVYQLAQSREVGQGNHWSEMTTLSKRDHLAASLVIPPDAEGYLFLTTLSGVVKRVRLEDLPGITTEPFTVINVQDDDALGWARITTGTEEVILVTASGQAIRFQEDTVRPMGLPAGGVLGIKLADEADGIVSMEIVTPNSYLWSITDNGLAKATEIEQYPTQGRHGQGVINVRLPKDAAEVVAAVIGTADTEIIITSVVGTTKQIKMGQTALGGRSIKPQSVWKVGPPNRITGAVRLTARVAVAEEVERETAVPQQLSLITDINTTTPNAKTKRKTKS
ncbi:MAG: DNA gyrase subunit A, partial [Chloroflexota bacterium]